MKTELTPFHGYLSQDHDTYVQDYQETPTQGVQIEYMVDDYQLRIVNTTTETWQVIAKVMQWGQVGTIPFNSVFTLAPNSSVYIHANDPAIPNPLLRVNALKDATIIEDLSLVSEVFKISLHWNASLIWMPNNLNVLQIQGNSLPTTPESK